MRAVVAAPPPPTSLNEGLSTMHQHTASKIQSTHHRSRSHLDPAADDELPQAGFNGSIDLVEQQGICFQGESDLISEPIRLDEESEQSLVDFFRRHRNVFLSKDHTTIPNSEMCPILAEWKSQPTAAHEQDALLMQSQIGMLGLRITSSTILGAELFLDEHTSLPEYHFTLLDSSLKATGAAPLVWLFTQLCSSDQIRTSSLTKVKCCLLPPDADNTSVVGDDSDEKLIQVSIEGTLKVEILDKMMHGTPALIERQGSRILSKFVQQESKIGLDKFQAAFLASHSAGDASTVEEALLYRKDKTRSAQTN